MPLKFRESLENSEISQHVYGSYGTNETENNNKSVNNRTDILQDTIGNFGRWQCRISILMPLLKFPIIWFELGIVFLAPPTDFWCKAPDEFNNISSTQWRALIEPVNISIHQRSLFESNSCFMKNIESNDTNAVVPCQWGYEYNRSIIHTSIITEWNLVCERESLVELTQVVLMFGVLIGSIIFGVAADRFGRRKILIVSVILQTIFGILSTVTPWYYGFLFFRFLLGIADGGTVITSFVMCMEVVGGPWRTAIPILYQIPGGIGNGIMASIAYFVRDWRQLQYILCALSALYFSYLWLIPESPRWLLAVGRHEEAIKILQSAAKTNGIDENTFKEKIQSYVFEESSSIIKPGLRSLIRTKQLRKRTILSCCIWLISGVIYYAFTQYIGQISQNIYFAVFIGGLTTIPGTLICVLVVKRCGRRATISFTCTILAITFLLILAVPLGMFPEDWPRIVLTSLAVVGISISVPALYLFTGELFPTVIRNTGVGTAVMCSRLGAMLAPLVIAMGSVIWFVPLVILAVIAIIEAFLICLLPETFNTLPPETILDIEELNRLSSHNSPHYKIKNTNHTMDFEKQKLLK